ncbi:MAG: HlyD family secretion protein [Candidatus Eiseniibacteriota bacterium]
MRLRRVGRAALAVLLAGCGDGDPNALVASGTVEATDAQLGFQASGRIVEIGVREGDAVKAGALLASLDRAEAEARRNQSDASLAAAKARHSELERGYRSEEIARARAGLDAARERLAEAERELARSQTLFDGGAVSREAHEQATLARDVARSEHSQAEEHLRQMERGHRREQVDAARAQVAEAEAHLAAAEAALRNMTIEAPFDGVVTVRHREPGEVVAAGAPVLTVMNPDDRWVRIYVREDRTGAVALGAKATIKSDTFPDKAYEGAVTFVASEAEFTPKNVQTTEERVKLVYAVKVSVRGDPAQELKPGMPADVELQLAEAAP